MSTALFAVTSSCDHETLARIPYGVNSSVTTNALPEALEIQMNDLSVVAYLIERGPRAMITSLSFNVSLSISYSSRINRYTNQTKNSNIIQPFVTGYQLDCTHMY